MFLQINRRQKSFVFTILGLGLSFCILVFVSLWHMRMGAADIVIKTIFKAIFQFDSNEFQHHIIVNQRLPRLYVAITCGATLGLAGFQIQKLFQNPLVSASTLGVTSGASLFVVLAIYFFNVDDSFVFFPAIVGACFAGLCTFSLTKTMSKSHISKGIHVVLSGSLISIFFGSIKTLFISLDPLVFQNVQDWMLGTINPSDFQGLKISYLAFVVFIVILLLQSRSLDTLMMGEQQAKVLGAHVAQIRFLTIGSVFVLSALCVAVVGPIGFVGLVVPHIAKLFVDETGIKGALLSMIIGAVVLVIADCIARILIAPKVLLVGAITAGFGGIFFLFLLFIRAKRVH